MVNAPAFSVVWGLVLSIVGLLLSAIGTLLWWQVRDLRTDVQGLSAELGRLSQTSAAGNQAMTDLRERIKRVEGKIDAWGPQVA